MKERSQWRLKTPGQFVKYCRIIICSSYTITGIAFISLIMTSLCFFFMHCLFKKLDERINEEAERNAQNLAMIENHILSQTKETERKLLSALAVSSEETIRTINRLDATYQNLLEAQRRRTLENFYNEDTLAAERKEAAAAFTAGRYVTASRLYGEIAAAHPEDQEARFYRYYALFLNNRQDRGNYRQIREAFTLLERQGYVRRELTETLEFIAKETGINRE